MTSVVGGGIGIGLCYALVERPTGALVVATLALGIVVANAVRQALGPGPR
jgi:hypothetical protein